MLPIFKFLKLRLQPDFDVISFSSKLIHVSQAVSYHLEKSNESVKYSLIDKEVIAYLLL